MDGERYTDLNELHNLANITFQNVTNLTPALRQLVVNAKAYQKSVHATCNLAVIFTDSLQNIAMAAMVSEGATKKIGDVLLDIIDTFKEIENMKLELTKLFINEVIIPLESRAEVQIGNMKLTHKSYNSENKLQTERLEKAMHSLGKAQKKIDNKKRRSPKLESKFKEHARNLDVEEQKLRKTREEGLRKALIEERRVYCFVAERMCAYGRGTVVYNNRISNFVNQKIPDWSQYISKPTELPAESEDIISNPTGYKMGTVKRKVSKMDKKDALKRGKSFANHYPTKYSTLDTRNSSRAGSRPSLSGMSGYSQSMSMTSDGMSTPSSETPTEKTTAFRKSSSSPQINYKYPASPGSTKRTSPKFIHSPKQKPKVAPKAKNVKPQISDPIPQTNGPSQNDEAPAENVPLQRFLSTKEELVAREEAIVATIVASNNAIKAEHSAVANVRKGHSPQGRSHSFSVQGKKDSFDHGFAFNRTGSSAQASVKKKKPPEEKPAFENSDFAARLSMIQTELHRQFSTTSSESKLSVCHKALYDHVAQDASQLSFQKGDVIIPTCEPTSGWQYGEHEKTKKSGWFPASYTTEVSVNENGESHPLGEGVGAESTTTIDSKASDSKKPPPVAKKSFKASHKKGGSGGTLPGKKKLIKSGVVNHEEEVVKKQQVKPQLTTSSSMPMLVHMLHQEKSSPPPSNANAAPAEPVAPDSPAPQPGRHSLIMNQDSFDTTDDENQPKDMHNGYRSDSSDSLPPPPPPPPISDDEEEETQNAANEKKENSEAKT